MPLGDLDFEVHTGSAFLCAWPSNNGGALDAAPAILHCFEGLSGKLVRFQLCSGREGVFVVVPVCSRRRVLFFVHVPDRRSAPD